MPIRDGKHHATQLRKAFIHFHNVSIEIVELSYCWQIPSILKIYSIESWKTIAILKNNLCVMVAV